MITRDGLIAEYLFNGNANDTSGNGFHGVVQGATPAADRFGNPNSAYAFDGKNDWIVVSPPPRLTNVELTVSVWARHSATKFERWWHDCIICQDDGDDNDHSRRIFQLSTSGDWVCWHRMVEVPDLCSIDLLQRRHRRYPDLRPSARRSRHPILDGMSSSTRRTSLPHRSSGRRVPSNQTSLPSSPAAATPDLAGALRLLDWL